MVLHFNMNILKFVLHLIWIKTKRFNHVNIIYNMPKKIIL